MTDQRDPDRGRHERLRGDNGDFNLIPILVGLALILAVGYMLFSASTTPTTNAPGTSQRTEAPTTAPRAPAPSAPK